MKTKTLVALTKRFGFFAFAMALLTLSLSCGDGGVSKADLAKQELTAGLVKLQTTQYKEASVQLGTLVDGTSELSLALKAEDEELYHQALFAYFIAKTFVQVDQWVEDIQALLQVFTSISADKAPATPEEQIYAALADETRAGLIGNTVSGLFNSFYQFFISNQKILAPLRNSSFQLQLTELPLQFGGLPRLFDLRGEYDRADVLLYSGLFQLVAGILKIGAGVNFDIPLNGLVGETSPLKYILDTFKADEKPFDNITLISNVIAVALNSFPNFLTIANSSDIELGGDLLASGFADIHDFFAALEEEVATDPDQTDDFIGYFPAEAFSEDLPELEFHIIPGDLFKIVPGLDPSALENFRVPVDPDAVNAIDVFARAFANEEGVRISWANDLVPILSVLAVSILRSGLIDGLLYAALDGANLDNDSLGSIQDLIFGDSLLSSSLVEGLLITVVPDVFEFDIGEIFTTLPSFRSFFPAWTPVMAGATTDPTNTTVSDIPMRNARLLVEFECVDESDDLSYNPPKVDNKAKLFCKKPNTAIDQPHFERESVFTSLYADATSEAVAMFQELHADFLPNLQLFSDGNLTGWAADGLEANSAYIAFQDPTFGKMLYIRLPKSMFGNNANLAEHCSIDSRYRLANNYCLNTLGNKIISDIIALSGG